MYFINKYIFFQKKVDLFNNIAIFNIKIITQKMILLNIILAGGTERTDETGLTGMV